MKVLILEYQSVSSKTIQKILRKLDIEISNSCVLCSIEKGMDWLKSNLEPDLIIANTHLSDGYVVNALKKLQIHCPIIFISEKENYVFESLKLNCVDYLLKPVKEDNLIAAVKKYIQTKKIPSKVQKEILPYSGDLIKNRFMVKYGDILQFKTMDEIAYFYAEEKIVRLVTYEGRKFLIDYSLEALEKMLDPKMFYRINRKFIAALQSIQTIKTLPRNRLQLFLKPKFEFDIFISKEKSAKFKMWLDS